MTTKGCAQLFEKKLKKLIKDKHVKRKNGQCVHVQISYKKWNLMQIVMDASNSYIEKKTMIYTKNVHLYEHFNNLYMNVVMKSTLNWNKKGFELLTTRSTSKNNFLIHVYQGRRNT